MSTNPSDRHPDRPPAFRRPAPPVEPDRHSRPGVPELRGEARPSGAAAEPAHHAADRARTEPQFSAGKAKLPPARIRTDSGLTAERPHPATTALPDRRSRVEPALVRQSPAKPAQRKLVADPIAPPVQAAAPRRPPPTGKRPAGAAESRGAGGIKADRPNNRGGGGGGGHGSGTGRGRGGGKRRGWLFRLLSWLLVLMVWCAIGLGGIVGYYSYDLPSLDELNHIDRHPSVTLVSTDGVTLATFGDLYGEFMPVKQMAPALPEAVMATEDRRFYHHFGVDVLGLLRATVANLRAGHIVQGGSTITQQLAKNVFLSPDRTIKRKVQEVLLALMLEHRLSKDQILSLYLNRVYFGAGTWGVDAAAHRYFEKSARDLTLPEAAMLAGLLKAPSRFAPTNDLAAARARAAVVLDRMVDAGFITPAQEAAAKAQPATLARPQVPLRNARYFADWVLERINDYIGADWQDVVVTTTMDLRLQRAAEAAVETVLSQSAEKRDAGQAALVAMTPDGAVRAMVGGRDYADSPFNRATQAKRQPGSSFKLFDYLAALESGLTPDSTFFDGPISVGSWQPRNFEKRYQGNVTMREALADSINTVAVEVTQRIGVNKVVQMAHRLGIAEELPANPSIALGTSEVNLLELTGAYDAVANGGNGVIPYGITEIRASNGQVLYKRQGGGLGQVLAPTVVRQITDMLTAVVRSGTGRSADIGRPIAGKTGTSQDFRDGWFIGFSAELTAGVWVGNDDDSPMKRVVGGSLPAGIWKNFMSAALAGVPPQPLLPNLPQTGPAIAGNPAPARAPDQRSLWDKIVSQFGGSSEPRTGRGGQPERLPHTMIPSRSDLHAPGMGPNSPVN